MDTLEKIKDYRIQSGICRGREIAITVDGKVVKAYEGETIGAVLTAAGVRAIRREPCLKDPRGFYCGMGQCYSCLVTVDGRPNVRACVTAVEAGQRIELQDGFSRVDMDMPGPPPAKWLRKKASLVIIGAGPAGLSAAIAAARAGAPVLVIDENSQAGGQIYRQLPQTFQAKLPGLLGADYADGQALLKQVASFSDRITIWSDALVWAVFDSRQLAIAFREDLVLLDTEAIVVATGAYERPVPVSGWTLPGVMTAGGAQALIKSQRIRPGHRVLLAGSGPLQLVVANQMLEAGMDVVAVAESASLFGAWRFLSDLMQQPALIKQGITYLYRLRKAGVRMVRSHVLQAVEGEQQVQRAVLAKVDSKYRVIPGQLKSFDVDTVCIGYGLIPAVRLTTMLGCRHVYNPIFAGWQPAFDENLQTDRSGIFVAGDGAGIAGVLVARKEGTIAGLYAAAHAGFISAGQAERTSRPIRKQLKALHRFRRAMDGMYPIHSDLYAQVSDDTIVCRCEGVTAGEIRQAVNEGTTDLNDIKKRTRSGMGYCQGTNCTPVVAAILEREFGEKPENIKIMTPRPPIRPIPLSLLMVGPEGDK